MINLHKYDIVIINSSGGKDSLCAVFEICRMADEQSYPRANIVVSHQELRESEWKGTKELVQKQSDLFGLKTYYSARRNKDGYEETFLEYAERRGKWPFNKQRWCTSDFKRGPGGRIVTQVTKELAESRVLYVFGFRAEESPSRKKKQALKLNKNLTTQKRIVEDYLPIHDWDLKKVWATIKQNNLPYHPAYGLGMPRLSCIFCIFSPFDALVIAGKANPDLLDKYIAVENKIKHTFKNGFSLAEVKAAIHNNYNPSTVQDWVM